MFDKYLLNANPIDSPTYMSQKNFNEVARSEREEIKEYQFIDNLHMIYILMCSYCYPRR